MHGHHKWTRKSLISCTVAHWQWLARQETPHIHKQRSTAILAKSGTTSQTSMAILPRPTVPYTYTQQIHALLTLFSKTFSPFPHGTCLLSVLNMYSAWGENYHHIGAPSPRHVTRRKHAVHGRRQMANRTVTLISALFQEAYICTPIGNASPDYNSRLPAPISMLSYSLFTRRYWRNPVWFQVLRLLICLNSAGWLA